MRQLRSGVLEPENTVIVQAGIERSDHGHKYTTKRASTTEDSTMVIDEAHNSRNSYSMGSGQLGGSVLDYDMGRLPSTCLQTIEDDIFDASPWSKSLQRQEAEHIQ